MLTAEIFASVWMELAMFAVAGLAYVLFVGVPRASPRAGPASFTPKVHVAKKKDHSAAEELLTEHEVVLVQWQKQKVCPEVMDELKLLSVAVALRVQGRSPEEIAEEFRSALKIAPGLLPDVRAVPLALLRRDDDAEVAQSLLFVLEDLDEAVEPIVYKKLMSAYLRRRNFEMAQATASKLSGPVVNLLVWLTAGLNNLDEALSQVRQLGEEHIGSGTIGELLSLGVRCQKLPLVVEELQRVNATLQTPQLAGILETSQQYGAAHVQAVFRGALGLEGVKACARCFQVMATAFGSAKHEAGLSELLDMIEEQVEAGQPRADLLSEQLVVAFMQACESAKQAALTRRMLLMAGSGATPQRRGNICSAALEAIMASCSAEEACDFFEHEIEKLPKAAWPKRNVAKRMIEKAIEAGRDRIATCLQDHLAVVKETPTCSHELQRLGAKIKSLGQVHQDLAHATQAFNRYLSTGTGLNVFVCNCYLEACVKCGDIDKAITHFRFMKSKGVLDVVSYNTLLKAYLAKGRAAEAEQLMQSMAAAGIQANKVTYNELLNSQATDNHSVWRIVDEMRKVGVKPNAVTGSILVKTLSRTGHIPSSQELRRIADLVKDNEEPLDEVFLAVMAEACIKAKDLDLLHDILSTYRGTGGSMQNIATSLISVMIKAFGAAGRIDKVRWLWAEMQNSDSRFTSISLGCMVEALVSSGHPEEAWELVHEQQQLKDRRCLVNTVIYSTVMKGFACQHNMEKVFAVYQEMLRENIISNTITYNTVFEACAKCALNPGTMAYIPILLKDMQTFGIKADVITYSTIIKALCMGDEMDKAFKILKEMKTTANLWPDEITFNSMLDSCARKHRTDDAMAILAEMRQAGIAPSNITLSILVKLLGGQKRVGVAFQLVNDLSREFSIRPNVQVYTCLASSCFKNRQTKQALHLHNEMVELGCEVDAKFYGVLVQGCIAAHRPLLAIEVARVAYKLPDHSLLPLSKAVGLDARHLQDLCHSCRQGGKETTEAFEKLSAELLVLGAKIPRRCGEDESRRKQGRSEEVVFQ